MVLGERNTDYNVIMIYDTLQTISQLILLLATAKEAGFFFVLSS